MADKPKYTKSQSKENVRALIKGGYTPEQIKSSNIAKANLSADDIQKMIDKSKPQAKPAKITKSQSVENVKSLAKRGYTEGQIHSSNIAKANLTPEQIQKIIDKSNKTQGTQKGHTVTSRSNSTRRAGGAGGSIGDIGGGGMNWETK